MFHSSLSNLYNNVIIYKIKTSCENSFVCERNVQNFPIHVVRALYIDVSLYLMLTIQASSRLKRSANHLWNNSDVCRKKFDEWSLLVLSTNFRDRLYNYSTIHNYLVSESYNMLFFVCFFVFLFVFLFVCLFVFLNIFVIL